MADKTPLADSVSAKKVVLGESLVTLDQKLAQEATDQTATLYQTTVLDYVTEWETILTKKRKKKKEREADVYLRKRSKIKLVK